MTEARKEETHPEVNTSDFALYFGSLHLFLQRTYIYNMDSNCKFNNKHQFSYERMSWRGEWGEGVNDI